MGRVPSPVVSITGYLDTTTNSGWGTVNNITTTVKNKRMILTTTTQEVGTNVRMLMLNTNNFVDFVVFDFVLSDCSLNIYTNVCSFLNGSIACNQWQRERAAGT